MKTTENREEISVTNLAKVEATFKKLPWLENHFCKKQIGKVSFLPITFETLAKDNSFQKIQYPENILFPEMGKHFHSASGEYEISYSLEIKRKICIFDKDGGFIGIVGVKIIPEKKIHYLRSKLLWFTVPARTEIVPEQKKLFSEIVSDTLKRLDPDDKAHYIICQLPHEKASGQKQRRTSDRLIVSLVGNGFTLKSWLEAQTVKSTGQIETEIETALKIPQIQA